MALGNAIRHCVSMLFGFCNMTLRVQQRSIYVRKLFTHTMKRDKSKSSTVHATLIPHMRRTVFYKTYRVACGSDKVCGNLVKRKFVSMLVGCFAHFVWCVLAKLGMLRFDVGMLLCTFISVWSAVLRRSQANV